MVEEALAAFPLETGGLLLGWWTGADAALVTDVIGPGPDALHAATQFEPDTGWQRTALAEAWTQHPGIEYLGDWHTHPNGTPKFSALDRAALATIAAHPAARAPRPWMAVIVVDAAGRISLHARCLVGGKLHRARATGVVPA